MTEKVLYNTNGTRTFIAQGPFTYEGWSRGGLPATSSADPGGSGGYLRKVFNASPGSSWTLVISNSNTKIYPTGSANTNGLLLEAASGSSRGYYNSAGSDPSLGSPDVSYSGQNGFVDGGGVRVAGNSPKPDGSYASTETTEDGGRGAYFSFGSTVPAGSPAGGARMNTDTPGNGQIRILYEPAVRKPIRYSNWL